MAAGVELGWRLLLEFGFYHDALRTQFLRLNFFLQHHEILFLSYFMNVKNLTVYRFANSLLIQRHSMSFPHNEIIQNIDFSILKLRETDT